MSSTSFVFLALLRVGVLLALGAARRAARGPSAPSCPRPGGSSPGSAVACPHTSSQPVGFPPRFPVPPTGSCVTFTIPLLLTPLQSFSPPSVLGPRAGSPGAEQTSLSPAHALSERLRHPQTWRRVLSPALSPSRVAVSPETGSLAPGLVRRGLLGFQASGDVSLIVLSLLFGLTPLWPESAPCAVPVRRGAECVGLGVAPGREREPCRHWAERPVEVHGGPLVVLADRLPSCSVGH